MTPSGAPSCTALAIGDCLVCFSLSLVLLLLGWVVFAQPFFQLVWRPHRIRHARRARLQEYRQQAESLGRPFDPAEYERHELSAAWHKRLMLDPTRDGYGLGPALLAREAAD